MSQALQFINHLIADAGLQIELNEHLHPLDFETVQSIAAKHDYHFTVDELNSALNQSPELVAQLQTLIDQAEIELDEAEMALIAGGGAVYVTPRETTSSSDKA